MQFGLKTLAPNEFEKDENGDTESGPGHSNLWNCEEQHINNALVGDIYIYKIPAGSSADPSDFNTQNRTMDPLILNEFHNSSDVIQMSKQPFSMLYRQNQVGNWSYPVVECSGNTSNVPDVGAFTTGHLFRSCDNKNQPQTYSSYSYTWNGETQGSAYNPPASTVSSPQGLLANNSQGGVEYFDNYSCWYSSTTPLTSTQLASTNMGKGNIINQLGKANTSSLNNLDNEYYKKINRTHLNAGDKVFVVLQASWWKLCSNPNGWQSSKASGAYFWQQFGKNRRGLPGRCMLYLNSGSFKATSLA